MDHPIWLFQTSLVTPGNVHDSVAIDDVYDKVTQTFPEIETIVADSAYKTPHICKKVFVGIVPAIYFTACLVQSRQAVFRQAGSKGTYSLSFRMVREMRFFFSSTSFTHTVTTSPTLSTSEGCFR